MVRRTREFDRSDFTGDLLESPLPQHHVSLRTNDRWRAQRRLMSDTMSTRFLHNTAAVQLYTSFTELCDLWRRKTQLANGRAIEVGFDIEQTMLDAICRVTFGQDVGALKAQANMALNLSSPSNESSSADEPFKFPRAPVPQVCAALQEIAHSSEIPLKSPLGRRHHYWALRCYPRLRTAVKTKNRFVQDILRNAWQKFDQPGATESDIRSAADLLVSGELTLARKEKRSPQHDSLVVQDELFGFLEAGHDTTSTSIEWGLKYLTQHQDAQTTLRQSLHQAFPEVVSDGKMPSARDIATALIPYLDAVLEEILRLAGTAGTNVRVATVDTEVLGYHIPKGTDVFLMVRMTFGQKRAHQLMESRITVRATRVPPCQPTTRNLASQGDHHGTPIGSMMAWANSTQSGGLL